MKKISFIAILVLFTTTLVFSDYRITRGPEVGEIYFIGPTVTEPAAIYRSIDFGETATCMDSTLNTNINFFSITADLTSGVLYGYAMPENLYRSYEYGEQGSWNFISNNGYWSINSGRNEGEIYNSIASHSENYGLSFINHSCSGFFGNLSGTAIDNSGSRGYAKVSITSQPDSMYLLISYDNFETLEIQNIFNAYENPIRDLSRGSGNGELYNFAGTPQTIFHSADYGLNWLYVNEFNPGLDYTDLVGGRQTGEVYVLVTYNELMYTIEHTYIFHSTDFGRTFTVYHSFSKGEEPLVANFSSSFTEGEAPFTAQFSNYSVGEIISYEWDFDNNGTIDSYDQNPEFTYLDTSYYSVKLIIHDQDDTDEFLREDFIHVTDGSGADNYELEIVNYELNNHSNPFNPSTTISFSIPKSSSLVNLEIYNIKGQKIKTFPVILSGDEGRGENKFSVVWNGTDQNNQPVSSGIYLYKLHVDGKTEAVKKCLLLK